MRFAGWSETNHAEGPILTTCEVQLQIQKMLFAIFRLSDRETEQNNGKILRLNCNSFQRKIHNSRSFHTLVPGSGKT